MALKMGVGLIHKIGGGLGSWGGRLQLGSWSWELLRTDAPLCVMVMVGGCRWLLKLVGLCESPNLIFWYVFGLFRRLLGGKKCAN